MPMKAASLAATRRWHVSYSGLISTLRNFTVPTPNCSAMWPFVEQAVAHVHGLLAVERHGEMPALGADLHGAPLAAGLRHRIDLGDIDDRAGAVGRVRALVEDVGLVAGLGADLLRIAADEDAAVGVVADPEFGAELRSPCRTSSRPDRPRWPWGPSCRWRSTAPSSILKVAVPSPSQWSRFLPSNSAVHRRRPGRRRCRCIERWRLRKTAARWRASPSVSCASSPVGL